MPLALEVTLFLLSPAGEGLRLPRQRGDPSMGALCQLALGAPARGTLLESEAILGTSLKGSQRGCPANDYS